MLFRIFYKESIFLISLGKNLKFKKVIKKIRNIVYNLQSKFMIDHKLDIVSF